MEKMIVNIQTSEIEMVSLTEAEIAEIEIRLQQTNDRLALEKNAEETKAAEKAALLNKLGITQSEAALLLS